MSARCARFLVLLCSMSAACGGASGELCAVDGDCASGFCKADGTCGPAADDAGIEPDAPSDGSAALCTPNHDGVITLAELPLAAGRMARFRIATAATWSTAGEMANDGTWRWDLTGQLANDVDREIALAAPSGAWWAAAFPTATYATELAADSDLRGAFEIASNLRLLGVVSPDSGLLRTELAYDPPADILALPLQTGATWSSTSTVSGLAQGAIVAYTERYESHVDRAGTMVTPYGEFPVVRIATDLTRTSGITTLATQRTFTWLAECFGAVATATSQPFEQGNEFTAVAEVRRLAP